MVRFLLVNATGWLAVLAVGIETALPFMLRQTLRERSARATQGLPIRVMSLRAALWPHYWIGYLLLVLVLLHVSFTGPAMGRSDVSGIWAATVALGLLFLQLGLGLILKSGAGTQRLRRGHFWSMVAFMGLLATHLVRNS